MKSAREIIAGDPVRLPAIGQLAHFQFFVTTTRRRPRIHTIRYAHEARSKSKRLPSFAGMAHKLRRKPTHAARWGLLRDQQHPRTGMAQVIGHSQQKRTAARNYDSRATNRHSGLHQSLQPPCTHHSRERPTREREKALTGSRGENYLLEIKPDRSLPGFCRENSWGGLRKNLGSKDCRYSCV